MEPAKSIEDQHFAKLSTTSFWCLNLQSGLIVMYVLQLALHAWPAYNLLSSEIPGTMIGMLVSRFSRTFWFSVDCIVLSLSVITICLVLIKTGSGKPKSLTLTFTMKWMTTLQIFWIWGYATMILQRVLNLSLATTIYQIHYQIHPLLYRYQIGEILVTTSCCMVTVYACYASHVAQEVLLQVADESNQRKMSSLSVRRAFAALSQSPFWCCNLRTGLIVVYTMETFCLLMKINGDITPLLFGVGPDSDPVPIAATWIPYIATIAGAPLATFTFSMALDIIIIATFSMMALFALIKVSLGASRTWKLMWSFKCMIFIGIWICCEAVISVFLGIKPFMTAITTNHSIPYILSCFIPVGSLLLSSFVCYVSFRALGVLHSVSVADSFNTSGAKDAQSEIP